MAAARPETIIMREAREAAREDGYRCQHRRMGFWNCHCARFEDGSCVSAWLYPEFSRRSDAYVVEFQRARDRSIPRTFADRSQYAGLTTTKAASG